MLRKAGHDITVIHAPAVNALEVLTDVVPRQRRSRTKLLVPLRVVVDVVDAEQERIDCLPSMAKGADVEDRITHPISIGRRVSNARPLPSPLTFKELLSNALR